MNIVSVINYKGGVGKTTIAANLAAELAWRSYNVLVMDLDPQSSMTFSFIQPDYWEKHYKDTKTIKSWFDSFMEGEIIPLRDLIISPTSINNRLTNKGKLDLIPSHLGLLNVDLELATELGGASLDQTKRNYFKVYRRLADGLSSISDEDYDIIIIDCPPSFNIVTQNAIIASDSILIPAKPDYLSTLGIDYLKGSLNSLIKNYNDFSKIGATRCAEINPAILGVIFTMVQYYDNQPIAATRQYINQAKNLDVPVFETYIRENKSLFADAAQYGVPVVFNTSSSTTYQRVVGGLEDFTDEFITKMRI